MARSRVRIPPGPPLRTRSSVVEQDVSPPLVVTALTASKRVRKSKRFAPMAHPDRATSYEFLGQQFRDCQVSGRACRARSRCGRAACRWRSRRRSRSCARRSCPSSTAWLAVMPDVHLRQGLNRRLRDPDLGRDHSGCRRSRHRLRHDGSAHLAHGDDLPDTLSACASRIEKAVPHGRTVGRVMRATRVRGEIAPGRSSRLAQPRGRVSRRSPTSTRMSPGNPATSPSGHARHRQPLHRGLPRRSRRASG